MTITVAIETQTIQVVLTPPDQPEIVLQVPAPVTVNLAAQGVQGPQGPSAYQVAVANGFVGTEAEWLASLSGQAAAASESTAGIAAIATQAETDAGTNDAKIVTPQKLAGWPGRVRRLSQVIGDGTATQFTITHNFNTRDIDVTVRRNSGNFDAVIVDVDYMTVNTVRLTFAAAPASGAFQVFLQA